MNYFIAGVAQPIIWIADHLEPLGIPRGLVKNVTGVCMALSGTLLLEVAACISVIACAIFPAFAAVTVGCIAMWGLTFGATKLVRFIPGLSEETKGTIVFTLNVIKSISKVAGLNILLPPVFIICSGVSMVIAPADEFAF